MDFRKSYEDKDFYIVLNFFNDFHSNFRSTKKIKLGTGFFLTKPKDKIKIHKYHISLDGKTVQELLGRKNRSLGFGNNDASPSKEKLKERNPYGFFYFCFFFA